MVMKLQETADCLAELGHATRLSIYRYLVTMGKDGVSVGDIQKKLKIPASTLSHHISRLTRVGLIRQKRDGTTLLCFPQYKKLQGLVDYLIDECCDGLPCLASTACCD